jgi:hypothetical protein
VVERGGGARLDSESLQNMRVAVKFARQSFQRDPPTEFRICRQ